MLASAWLWKVQHEETPDLKGRGLDSLLQTSQTRLKNLGMTQKPETRKEIPLFIGTTNDCTTYNPISGTISLLCPEEIAPEPKGEFSHYDH